MMSIIYVFLFHFFTSADFDNGRVVGRIDNSKIRDISGMAASRKHNAVIYVHNDQDGDNK